MAPSPAVVDEEAEVGVLLWVLHALQVRRHVSDVDGVLFLPFLCGGARRWEGGGVTVEPRPRDVRQVTLEGRPVLGGALAGFVGGLVAPQGVGQVCPGRPLVGWGSWGGILRAGLAGVRGVLVAGSCSGGDRSICCSVSSVCWRASSSRLSMSRAMGSSWACWDAASWCGGCVMLVLGVCAAAGAGPCAGARGSAWFGVVVVCACSLVAVLAGGVAPGRVSGCGRWWVSSWRVVCGGSRGSARGGGVECRAGVAWHRSCVGGLWCFMSSGGGGGCGVAWWCSSAWWPYRWGGGGACPGLVGWVVARGWSSGGVGRPCAVSWSSLWCVSVRGPCGSVVVWGLGVPWGGVCGIGVSQPGGCGRVVLGVVGPPLSGPSGAGSAVYGPHAGCHVCGVCGSPGRGVVGVLRPRCGVRGWGVVVRGWGVPSPRRGGAVGSGVGWVRGRLAAGSGCRGLVVGGSSAVSSWCVPWWPLVGRLGGVFGVYHIHGGITVCWRAVVGCGGGACVGVVRVVSGDVSCVVLGGSSWGSVVAVRGGWSWAWRFLGGGRTCGVGTVGGGGARVRVGSCVHPLLPLRFIP